MVGASVSPLEETERVEPGQVWELMGSLVVLTLNPRPDLDVVYAPYGVPIYWDVVYLSVGAGFDQGDVGCRDWVALDSRDFEWVMLS